MSKPVTGAELISAERMRQINEEGWAEEHDDCHVNSELIWAARCYAMPGVNADSHVPVEWPWHPADWKPSDDSEWNLMRAGALIGRASCRERV